MPNNNVFRGSDATLNLAVNDTTTVEGGLAEKLIDEYKFSNLVGRLTNVQVRLENDVKPYHEIGNRFPTELRPGNLNVMGTIERAHINGALLRLLLGDGNTSPVSTIPQPVFEIVINMTNPANPDSTTKVIVSGVKFDSWNFMLPEDHFIMESITFRAISIKAEEKSPV